MGGKISADSHDLDSARPIISLVPGSRHKELHRILPEMLDAAALISQSRPDVQFVVVVAPSRTPDEVRRYYPGPELPHHRYRKSFTSSITKPARPLLLLTPPQWPVAR